MRRTSVAGRSLLFALILLAAALLSGAELAGVSMPAGITVAGKTLKLNGLGLRTKVFFKIYVAGLYLETPTRDPAMAVSADQVKRVVMHFLYKKVTAQQLVDAWRDDFRDNSPETSGTLKQEISQFCSWMTDVAAGQEIVLTYEPGTGTTVEIGGRKKGTIAGVEFMRALFRVWLGEHPPNAGLKAGMMGQKN